MSNISVGYDDLLDIPDHRLRNRLIAVGASAVILAAAAYGIWSMFFSGDSSTQAQEQTATVDRGNVTKTVSTSGVVAAQQTSSLSFQQSGKVQKVNVTLGQKVKQGDVLAEVDPTDLQSALDAAGMNLASAQLKLTQLLQGSTDSQLASADQSQTQAQAGYDKAVRALNALAEPASATDLAAAQQAVASAQAQVAQAQQSRTKLDQTSQDAVTAAQAAVDKAQKALDRAQGTASTADATVSSAQSSLYNAETAYCPDSGVGFCSSHEAPLSSGDQDTLVSVSDSGAPARAALASKVLGANTSYAKALADQQTASDAVDTANSDLQSAEDALSKAEAGPTSAEIASADAAVNSANASLNTAEAKLATLGAGATQDALDAAQADVDTAAAGLRATQAKRDETYQGALPADIQQQRQAVATQQLAVDKAQRDLDKTKLIAPFDGTIAVLNIQVGDNAGSGSGTSGSSSSAAIVLNTPDAVRIDLSISETDLPNVKIGQNGVAQFDAIPGASFPLVIDSIGTNPTTTQGVVTYAARARLLTAPPADAGAPGAPGAPNAAPPAAGTPQPSVTAAADGAATGTPGARQRRNGGTPGAGTQGAAPGGGGSIAPSTTAARPAPGMNARITIIAHRRQNVLRVPSSAIQRNGADSVVQVKKSDGSTEMVPVQTGLADATNTEITGGVDEGMTVIIPVRTASTQGTTGVATGAGGGFGGFGGRGGGGGGGGARAGGD